MSIRELVRAALSREQEHDAERRSWPPSPAGVVVDNLIEAGRRLDHAARLGNLVDHAEAQDVVDSLSAYVATLPPEDQAGVARRLVEELSRRTLFTPTVLPSAQRAAEITT